MPSPRFRSTRRWRGPRRRYKARAVRAEEKRHGDRVEYRIRLLGDDGRVFEVRIDAATGRES